MKIRRNADQGKSVFWHILRNYYIKKMKTTKIKVDVNVNSKITNYENTYGRDNTPQASLIFITVPLKKEENVPSQR